MKTLENTIKKNGFTYKLHKREDDLAIYEQWDYDNPDKPILIAYEVFIVKITKDFEIKGKQITGGERFPRNEDFGYTAWTYSTFGNILSLYPYTQYKNAKELAYNKFEYLKNRENLEE